MIPPFNSQAGVGLTNKSRWFPLQSTPHRYKKTDYLPNRSCLVLNMITSLVSTTSILCSAFKFAQSIVTTTRRDVQSIPRMGRIEPIGSCQVRSFGPLGFAGSLLKHSPEYNRWITSTLKESKIFNLCFSWSVVQLWPSIQKGNTRFTMLPLKALSV